MATLTIADLDNSKRDLETVDAVANSQADTTITRYGDARLTLAGALRRLGWQAPVPYASGLTVDHPTMTVERDGVVYRPDPALVPFTSGAWNPDQWRVVQNSNASWQVYRFATHAEAESAAATLLEGSTIIAEGESLGRVEAGVYVPDSGTPAVTMLDYAELEAYRGRASAADVTNSGIAGRFYRRGTTAANGGTVIKDALGRSWERENAFPLCVEWFGAKEGQDITSALQTAINVKGSLGWQAGSSLVTVNGNYRIDGKVILLTDVEIVGNWGTISSSSNDWIFVTGYKDTSGNIVTNDTLSDAAVIANARLLGSRVRNFTFVNVSRAFKLRGFTERSRLEDLLFVNCGEVFDTAVGFYCSFSNILVRGVKPGFEEYPAYTLRRASNLIDFTQVSVANRKYGRLVGDDEITGGTPQPYYENLTFRSCSYEQVTSPVIMRMKGYGNREVDWYAESVSGPLYKSDGAAEHYDLRIEPSAWAYGVERVAELKNLRGRSYIYQPVQHNYTPGKPSEVFLTDSDCTVELAPKQTHPQGLSYTGTSRVHTVGVDLKTSPESLDRVNGKLPINTTGLVAMDYAAPPGITSVEYKTTSFEIKTSLTYSDASFVIFFIKVYDPASPGNNVVSIGCAVAGRVQKFFGNDVSIGNGAGGDVQLNVALGAPVAWGPNAKTEGFVRFV